MKKAILLLCCMVYGYCTLAQKLKRIEYFIDTDPGTGKAKNISITQNDTVSVATAIAMPVLTPGLHVLYLRAANENGWGHTAQYPFMVTDTAAAPAIVRAEYFVDTDPGTGHASNFNIVPADSVRMPLNIAAGSLAEGMHTLYVRVQSSNGAWSITEKALFYVTPLARNAAKLSGAEYFIDTDPGIGRAKSLKPPGKADTLKGSLNIKVPAGISGGVYHYFCIRFKDNDGNWGLYATDSFYVSAAGFSSIQLQLDQENRRQANLRWNVSGFNAGVYEIEKSSNGIDFYAIGEVNAVSGKQLYHATDVQLQQASNFYRISHTDAAGNTSYSNIARLYLQPDDAKTLHVYPNPVKDVVNVQYKGAGRNVFISLYDAGGRQVKNWQMTAQDQLQLHVNGLSTGNYLLHLSDGYDMYTTQLVIQ